MAKVTVHETPAQQVVAKAEQKFNVTDSTGRVIGLKKPSILAQYRIVEVAGDSAKNEVYMRMILPLIYVAELDGEPVFQPINKMQLEGLMQRLDEHGVNAVMDGVLEHFGQHDGEGDKAALKK